MNNRSLEVKVNGKHPSFQKLDFLKYRNYVQLCAAMANFVLIGKLAAPLLKQTDNVIYFYALQIPIPTFKNQALKTKIN